MVDELWEDVPDGTTDEVWQDVPEQSYSGWSDVPASVAANTWGGIKNTVGGGLEAISDGMASLFGIDTTPRADDTLEEWVIKDIADNDAGSRMLRSAQDTLREANQKYQFEPWSGPSIANRVGSGVGQIAPVLAAGAMGAPVLPLIAAQSFGTNYGNAQAEGQSGMDSAYRGIGNAALDTAFGAANLRTLFKPDLGTLRKVAESSVVNVLTDPFQNIGNQRINEATGAQHVSYDDLHIGESMLSAGLMGAALPIGTDFAMRQQARFKDAQAQKTIDAIRAQMEGLEAARALDSRAIDLLIGDKTSLPTEDGMTAQAIIDSQPDITPRLMQSKESQKATMKVLKDLYAKSKASDKASNIVQAPSFPRTPEFQAELDQASRPQTQFMEDQQGRPLNAPPPEAVEASPLILPYTQKGDIRKSLAPDEQQLVKQMRLAEERKATQEAQKLPAIIPYDPVAAKMQSAPQVDTSNLPGIMDYTLKNLSDKGSREGLINSVKLQTEAWYNKPKGQLPSENSNATRRLEAAKTKGIQENTMAVIKEINAERLRQKKIEEQSYPTVIPPKPEKPLTTKAINSSSFPKVMEYVSKAMPDQKSQQRFVDSINLERQNLANQQKQVGYDPDSILRLPPPGENAPAIPDPKVEAAKQIQEIKQQDTAVEITEPPQSRSMLAEHGTVELPTKLIQLSKDVPNFKSGANERGVVDGEELKAAKYDRLGTAPIVVWKRLNGDLEVISGRHRLDLAKRLGEKTIPSQVVSEADGFTGNMARILDAELNIRDGNGKISDYATYFKEAGITEGEAAARGLLSRSKGIQGFDIGTKSSPELSALYNSGKINDARAAAIARGAPNNSDIQRAGIKAHLDRPTSPEALESLTRRLAEDPDVKTIIEGKQGDIFGGGDGAVSKVVNEARVSGIMAQEIQKKITAAYDAAKNPKLAKEMGVDAKDPEGTLKRISELKAAKEKWVEHWKYPELKQEMASRVAEYEKEQKASTLKKVKRSLNGESGAVINPFYQKDAIKAITQNMEDKELQKAFQQFGKNIETQVQSVRKLGIEKTLENDFYRTIIAPQSIAETEPKFRPFIDTAKRGREISMTVAHDLLQKASDFIKQPSAGRMWEYAAAAREAGSKFQWAAENFQKLGATESEVQGLMALRETMDSALPVYRDVLIREGMAPELAQAKVDEMQKANYVPFSRFGDKFIQLNDPETGEQVYFAKYETDKQKNDVLKRIAEMQKQNPEKQLQVVEGDFGQNPDSLFGGNSPNGFNQHLKKSFNVPGYQKNMKRAVSEYISSLSTFAAKSEMKIGFDEAFKNLPPNSPQLAKYAQDYAQYQLSNEGEASSLRKVMTAWFLAGRVSSGVLNLTQQLTTTLPRAQAEVGTAKALQYWGNSRKLLIERLIGGEGKFAQKYPELNEAINVALKHGSISEQSLRELTGRARSQTGEVSGFDEVMDKGMFFFDAAEKSNRYHAFLTGYQIAKSRGMDSASATKFGEQFSDRTQFDYSKINRPKFARGKIGAPLTTFQLFKYNDLKFTLDLAKASLKGDTKAMQGLATKVGVMVALAGLAGSVPGTKEINKVLESAGVDVRGSLRDALKDQKFLSDMLDNGLTYAFGLPDISGSLSNEVLSLPTDFNAEGTAATVGKFVGGVPLAMLGKMTDAAKLASEGEYMKAFQAGAPSSISAMAKAFEAAAEGRITNTRGQAIVEDPTLGELGSMALGFTPARSREFNNKSRSIQIFNDRVTNNGGINKKIAEARMSGDRELERRLWKHNNIEQKLKPQYEQTFPNTKAINDFIVSMQDPIKGQLNRMPNRAKAEAQRRFGNSSLGSTR